MDRPKTKLISLRLPEHLVERAEKIAETANKDPKVSVGSGATVTSVLIRSIEIGMPDVEKLFSSRRKAGK
ncbi:MAG: hypothetical protein KC964_29690 [Candidatus Omnitrophica bacterium]|nr:hypothetical protein [Candidatus Omnitrophota bacterium]